MQSSSSSEPFEFDVVKKRKAIDDGDASDDNDPDALASFEEFERSVLPALQRVQDEEDTNRRFEVLELEDLMSRGMISITGGVYFAWSDCLNCMKIGATRRDGPEARLQELSRHVTSPFELVAWYPSPTPFKLEAKAHKAFHDQRINFRNTGSRAGTEFFRISHQQAVGWGDGTIASGDKSSLPRPSVFPSPIAPSIPPSSAITPSIPSQIAPYIPPPIPSSKSAPSSRSFYPLNPQKLLKSVWIITYHDGEASVDMDKFVRSQLIDEFYFVTTPDKDPSSPGQLTSYLLLHFIKRRRETAVQKMIAEFMWSGNIKTSKAASTIHGFYGPSSSDLHEHPGFLEMVENCGMTGHARPASFFSWTDDPRPKHGGILSRFGKVAYFFWGEKPRL